MQTIWHQSPTIIRDVAVRKLGRKKARKKNKKKQRIQDCKKARKQESKIVIGETACGHLGYGAVRMFRIKLESTGTLPVSNLIQLFVEGNSGDQIA